MLKIKCLIFLIYALAFTSCNRKSDKNNMFTKKRYVYETTVNIPVKLNYYLYIPDEYNNTDSLFSMVLYLHGVGERGTDLNKLELNGIPELISKGKEFPFLTLAPQCPEFGWWSRPEYVEALANLTKEIIRKYRIDERRVYMSGLSMGGYGTLALAKAYPQLFSAIIPICGGMDNYEDIERLENMPIWLFHGDMDKVHPLEYSTAIYDLLKPINKDIKLTVYEGVGHNSWDKTYANDKIYEWLISHKKE